MVGCAQIVQVRGIDLVETGGAAVQPPEAVAPGVNVQHGLDHSVHQELVAQDAVQVEQIERQQAASRVEAPVGKQHGDVVGAAGEVESSGLVAGVELIEQEVEPCQALVGILRREVHAVV